jgi:hypothetical protein
VFPDFWVAKYILKDSIYAGHFSKNPQSTPWQDLACGPQVAFSAAGRWCGTRLGNPQSVASIVLSGSTSPVSQLCMYKWCYYPLAQALVLLPDGEGVQLSQPSHSTHHFLCIAVPKILKAPTTRTAGGWGETMLWSCRLSTLTHSHRA